MRQMAICKHTEETVVGAIGPSNGDIIYMFVYDALQLSKSAVS